MPGDFQFHDLLHEQLYPPADREADEPQDLKTTPHGEIADIVLADASADFLSLYPVLLLAGDQDFSGDLVQRLHRALNSTANELILQQWHVAENKWRGARYGMDALVITNRMK